MKWHLGTGRDIVTPLDGEYSARPMVSRQLPDEVKASQRHLPVPSRLFV